jgi:hypothetical protein
MSDNCGEDRATLRPAGPADAAPLLRLKQRLDRETSFMLLEPGERDTLAEALARHLGHVARSAALLPG